MNDETMLRALFAPARDLEASENDVEIVVGRLDTRVRPTPHRGLVGRPVAWLTSGLLILTGLMAVPPVRAALGEAADSLGGTFAGYFQDEATRDAPGRPTVASDKPPAWLNQDGRTGQRLLASEGGYELYVVRQPSGSFGFALDDSVGISDSAAGWQRQFSDHAVVILGPIADPSLTEVPLFGVNSATVVAVRINYPSGKSTTFNAEEGGFVAMLNVSANPRSLTGLDANGNEVETLYLSNLSLAD